MKGEAKENGMLQSSLDQYFKPINYHGSEEVYRKKAAESDDLSGRTDESGGISEKADASDEFSDEEVSYRSLSSTHIWATDGR
ncbi:unnamed protein product [Gongylonema pulchrum]|uniref:Ovule protein n=1 Tax=Gongylonema pulchrum TaxID=637853 RepID=A0A183ET86_9BILA|nr:unnamed protein product [Gongylonema pulchrum]